MTGSQRHGQEPQMIVKRCNVIWFPLIHISLQRGPRGTDECRRQLDGISVMTKKKKVSFAPSALLAWISDYIVPRAMAE